MDRSAELRDFFSRYVVARAGVKNEQIRQAFAAVPREPFAGKAPWTIYVPGHGYIQPEGDDIAYLYQDTLIALDASRGINIGEPSLHARCLAAIGIKPGETVLHIGAGAGYYTSILAHLVGENGRVHAFEIEPALAMRARENTRHNPIIEIHARSGVAARLPRADVIYVNAGSTQPNTDWLDALKPGGRLIFPLQAPGRFGAMLRIHEVGGDKTWRARFIGRAGFISCQGAQDMAIADQLNAAFIRGGWEKVRSLRTGTPDQTCWFSGTDWWLSTQKI